MLLFLLNSICYAGQSATGKWYAKKGGQAHSFNISKALAAAVLFLLWVLLSGKGIHLQSAPLALLYGICLTISMYTGFMALSCGPMALTGIIAAMSLLIPLFWGIVFQHEHLTFLQSIGICLLICAIFCICFKKQAGFSGKWLFYSLMTMLTNGLCSVIQTRHQSVYPGQYQADFMFYAMTAVFLLYMLRTLLSKKTGIRICLLGTCSGILNGLANFIILLLAAKQAASTLFPLISAGNVAAAWLTGILFFRERISKLQLLGLIFGIGGIILLRL